MAPPVAAAPLPVAAPPSAGHIPSLDGLRAISFLLVFVAHAGLDDTVPGGFGVTIFFFLSGFLITTLMRTEYARHGTVNLRHFWLRRVLRILPPFYLVLFCAIAAALLFDPPGSLRAAPVAAQLLHVTNYWIIFHGFAGQPVGTGVYWSLAVEEHFYLLFPWLFLLMQRARLEGRQQALLLWSLCLAVLLWRCYLVYLQHAPMNRTYMATDTRVDSILFGCALAVWGNPVIDAPRASERLWKLLLLPVAAAVLLGCVLVRDAAFRETWRYSLQGAALSFVFIAAIRFHHWPVFRVLNWRLPMFLGLLSYSLYLIHYAVLAAVQRLLPQRPPLARGAIALLLCVFLSWCIYRVVERPCARLRRRLVD